MKIIKRSVLTVLGLAFVSCLLAAPSWAQLRKHKPLVVTFVNSQGQKAGTARLTPERGGVKISLSLENLPEGEHAIHFHEHAQCDPPDFASAGGHFNPFGKEHGTKNPRGPHAGDMPINIDVEPNGSAHVTFVAKTVTMKKGAKNSIFADGGTSIVIHAKPDDMISQPAGNAGARIACAPVRSSESGGGAGSK